MHKSIPVVSVTGTTKESQRKLSPYSPGKKKNFLSPFAKEKSNIAYTGETRLRKKRVESA